MFTDRSLQLLHPCQALLNQRCLNVISMLGTKGTGLLLSGLRTSFQIKVYLVFYFQIKVLESGGRVDSHRIPSVWSPVSRFCSLWWFVMSPAVFYQSKQSCLTGDFKALHASICWQALWRCIFSQQDWAPAHRAKTSTQWFADHDINMLDCSADQSPTENLWWIVKRTMRNTRPKNPEELKTVTKAT